MRTSTPRVVAIHDLSGFGRCALTVVIPILSTLGIQVCPMPTAVLSTHTTEFTGFSFLDLTAEMRRFLAHWGQLRLQFQGVYSGFLGSPPQVEIVRETIEALRSPDGLTVVDPVMGDNGKLDPTITPELVRAMRRLVAHADCITPNYSEAGWLLDEAYTPRADLPRLKTWLRRLTDMGPDMAVITSAPLHDAARHVSVDGAARRISVVGHQASQNRFWKVDCPYIPAFYPGTGDAFASVLTGCLLGGDSLPLAMDRAVRFVTLALRATFGHDEPTCHGVRLERVLDTLRAPLSVVGYELLEDD